ncbi:MAG: NUDIX domain-containing protein [Deltaproteobacteria bacterium]|nr:NUDIX domain-containing protein [Deltaproteobacteria bacterium]
MTLARLPVSIEVVEDHTPTQPSGFLRLRRLLVRVHRDGAAASEPHLYDLVERRALDAVVLLLFDCGPDGALRVLVRSNVRPPLALRGEPLRTRLGCPEGALPDAHPTASTWELPAGLIEPHEIAAARASPEDALRTCASREAMEETGHAIEASHWTLLGAGAFLSPGLSAERVYFLAAELPADDPGDAHGDGSPFEHGAETRLVHIDEVLRLARAGVLDDLKTETGVARLRDAWSAGELVPTQRSGSR